MLLLLAACGKGRSHSTRTAEGLSEEAEASLDGVYRTSKATEEAVLAGADKPTFKKLRSRLAGELSKAESVAAREAATSENPQIWAQLRNYKAVLWAYGMYAEAWDFHDAYWTNCIKKGRSAEYCVDKFRTKGSELIAEAANIGITIFPFERDPMQPVWTVASRYQDQAEARFLGQKSQLQQ